MVRPSTAARSASSAVAISLPPRASSCASICAGGDVSCLMNIGGAALKENKDITTVHFAEILASTREHPLEVTGRVAMQGAGRN